MKLPDTLTLFGGPAAVAQARALDLFEFQLDGKRYVDQNLPAPTQEGDVAGNAVVNVVGLAEAGACDGWLLLLG